MIDSQVNGADCYQEVFKIEAKPGKSLAESINVISRTMPTKMVRLFVIVGDWKITVVHIFQPPRGTDFFAIFGAIARK